MAQSVGRERQVADERAAERLLAAQAAETPRVPYGPLSANPGPDGRAWLLSNANPSGSWGSTYEFVDTCTAVETLATTDPASEQVMNGAWWLAGLTAANYEYLARQAAAVNAVPGLEEVAGTLMDDLWAVRNPPETETTLPNWPEGGWGLSAGYATDCMTTAVALHAVKAAGQAGGMAVQNKALAAGATNTHELDVPSDALKVRISIHVTGSEVRLFLCEGTPMGCGVYFIIPPGTYLVTYPDNGVPFTPGQNYISIQSTGSAASYTLQASYETPTWDTRHVWDPDQSLGQGYGPLEYLIRSQNGDGGWGLQRGQDTELYTTLHVLQTLLEYTQYDLSTQRTAGINYLKTQQLAGGGFGYSGMPLPYVTALAVRVLVLDDGYPFETATQNAITALLGMQDPDGSWDSEAYDTALAVMALWDHNQTPTCDAGTYPSEEAPPGSCGAQVDLCGSASDLDGTIVDAVWREGDRVICTSLCCSASLKIGPHTLTLTVTDDGGKWASDQTVVQVVLPPVIVLQANMDTDPGWSTQGLWQWGVPLGQDGWHGNQPPDGPDPTSGYTGSNVYGYNLAGGYEDNLPATSLTTPTFDCTGLTGVTLRFWRWLSVEDSTYDHASLQVSNNPTDPDSWVTIWDHVGSTLTDAVWSLREYDLSSVADDQPQVAVRWVMGPTDYAWNYGGWNIDDVEVFGGSAAAFPVVPGDFDQDCDVDLDDLEQFEFCASGPGIPHYGGCDTGDFDIDSDVDQADFAAFQRCLSGEDIPANLSCAD